MPVSTLEKPKTPRSNQPIQKVKKIKVVAPQASYNIFGMRRKRKIPKKELVHLTSQIAIMTQSGVDIVSALSSLIKQTKTPDTKVVLSDIHEKVVAGNTFSSALSKHNEVFGESFVASVCAAEASGRMSEVLAELAMLHRNELRMRRSIKTMAAYPIVLIFVSLSVISALLFFVLPQFAKIFNDFDTPLPWITQFLIVLSEQMVSKFWIWVPALVVSIFGVRRYLKTDSGKRVLDYSMLNLPVLGQITRLLLVGRVCRLLGLLIDSGVTLLESFRLVRTSVSNVFYQDLLLEIEQNVLSGSGLGNTLHASHYVPDSAAEMILTAEKTGTLGTATQLIGDHYVEEGEEKLRGMISVMEPVITVIMGAVVAFVVLAVALPMFDLANVVQQ